MSAEDSIISPSPSRRSALNEVAHPKRCSSRPRPTSFSRLLRKDCEYFTNLSSFVIFVVPIFIWFRDDDGMFVLGVVGVIATLMGFVMDIASYRKGQLAKGLLLERLAEEYGGSREQALEQFESELKRPIYRSRKPYSKALIVLDSWVVDTPNLFNGGVYHIANLKEARLHQLTSAEAGKSDSSCIRLAFSSGAVDLELCDVLLAKFERNILIDYKEGS